MHSEFLCVPIKNGLQDAQDLFSAVKHFVAKGSELGAKSFGLATYRASTVAWKKDGTPLTPIVTWTDRSVDMTYKKLRPYFKLVGKVPPFDLIISPYSPVMKFLRLRELNPNMPEDHMEWTVDGYLAYRLTGRFVSDATNATLTGVIDPSKLKPIGIVRSMFGFKTELPEIVENAERVGSFGNMELNSVIADQQAAGVAEGATERGVAKVTNGTGTFVDIPTDGFQRRGDLVPEILLRHKGVTCFGVEGYLPTTGVSVDMMKELGILKDYAELENATDSENVLFLPAFAGLQVPRVPFARGLIAGLDASSDKNAIISGLLKSITFHVKQVLRADGGLSKSDNLMKRISAVTGKRVERMRDTEATSQGLAMLQMVSLGKESLSDLTSLRGEADVFSVEEKNSQQDEYDKWLKLIELLKSSKGSFLAD
jgi:glycerol kinase